MTDLNGNSTTLTAVRPDIFQIYLHDEHGQNILSIDDGALRHSLRIEIVNTSGKSIEFQSVDNQPTLKNYHFCISFRLGTLLLTQDEDKRITLKETDEGWQIQQQNNTFYLLLNSAVPKVINNGERITLTLENIGAAPGGGSRGTRVEIKYNNLQYQGSNETISGNRLQYLNIVNHRGKKQIPLYVGFIGSNTILNDGTENELTLTIQTLHGLSVPFKLVNETDVQIDHDKLTEGGLSLRGINDRSLDEATKFTISFDVADDVASTELEAVQNWALVNTNDSDNIDINITKGEENWIDAGKEKLGITPQWSFICKQGRKETSRQEILRLNISKIKTQLLAGYANLYVHYENIPGYWDGYITVPIHKGPLVYRETTSNNLKVGCVGIGTDKPQAKLHVKSANGVDGLKVQGNTAITGQLSVTGDVGIGTTSTRGNLEVVGDETVARFYNPTHDASVLVESGLSYECYLRFKNETTDDQAWMIGMDDDEQFKIAYGRDTEIRGNETKLYVGQSGNVGVGTDNPAERLQIADFSAQSDNYLKISTAGGNRFRSGIKLRAYNDEHGFTIANDDRNESYGLNILHHNNETTGKSALFINKINGNVGIATTNTEGNKLKVQGNTAIRR